MLWIFLITLGVIIAVQISKKHLKSATEPLARQFAELRSRLGTLEKELTEFREKGKPVEGPVQVEKGPEVEPPVVASPPPPQVLTPSTPEAPATSWADTYRAESVEVEPIATEQVISKLFGKPTVIEQAIGKLFGMVVTYFKTGNTVVKVGVIILFFGVSFLVKYAADRGIFPIEFRLLGAAIGAIVLTQFGWRLRKRRANYGLVLQGGGVGILFITTFAALRLYHLIPVPFAFLVMGALAGLTAWMAVLQNSRSLAAFGITGGFLAPILASTGEGNHVVLFSFYALLNSGIFAIAWFKAWRILNLLGFLFTFVIGTTWGVLKYQPDQFWTVEPFLVLFFLMYVAIPILFAKKQVPKLKGYVDGTLVFGNTIIAFGLQTQLVKYFEYGAAFSALTLSVFYIVLGRFLFYRGDKNDRMLVEAFVALGIVFATLTIPLAFDGHWTAAIWAMEAAGIFWVSTRQGRFLGRIFSTLLMAAAGISFLTHHQREILPYPFLNSFYLGCFLVASGALLASYVSWRYREKLKASEQWLAPAFFVYGSVWWVLGGLEEIRSHLEIWWNQTFDTQIFSLQYLDRLSLIYVGLGVLLSCYFARRLRWVFPNVFNYTFVVFIFLFGLGGSHPFAYGGWIVFPAAFALYYFVLRQNEKVAGLPTVLGKLGHAATLWLAAILGTWEFYWQVDRCVPGGEAWIEASVGVVSLGLMMIVLFAQNILRWPLKKYSDDYLKLGLMPIFVVTWGWVLITNLFCSGGSSPLPYLPLLNPLELVHGIFMLLMPIMLLRLRSAYQNESLFRPVQIGLALGATYFLWLNGILLRAIHHYGGIDFRFSALFDSVLVQASLSIYWSLIGIGLMIVASRRKFRWLWVSGASLMGIVVLKLFLVDLSKTGTVERIVSFLSVGILLLIVGYFSPIPPKREGKD